MGMLCINLERLWISSNLYWSKDRLTENIKSSSVCIFPIMLAKKGIQMLEMQEIPSCSHPFSKGTEDLYPFFWQDWKYVIFSTHNKMNSIPTGLRHDWSSGEVLVLSSPVTFHQTGNSHYHKSEPQDVLSTQVGRMKASQRVGRLVASSFILGCSVDCHWAPVT